MTEILPLDLSEDLTMLTKNGWKAEVSYAKTLPGYTGKATRMHWALHFNYPDAYGTLDRCLLFKRSYGDAGIVRPMSREQMKRFAGMSDEGREANYGKATI